MNQSDEAEFPHGWVLARPSYGFHRTFSRVVGRPALLGEYSRLSRQVRNGGAEQITDTAWRVATDTGETVVLLIRRQGRHVSPILVLPLAWRPAERGQLSDPPVAEAAPPTPSPPSPPALTVAPASPAATSPNRLTLRTTGATALLQARLRSAGIISVG